MTNQLELEFMHNIRKRERRREYAGASVLIGMLTAPFWVPASIWALATFTPYHPIDGWRSVYRQPESVARYYDGTSAGSTGTTLYQGFDDDQDGAIDRIRVDEFPLAGRVWFHAGHVQVTPGDERFTQVHETLVENNEYSNKDREL